MKQFIAYLTAGDGGMDLSEQAFLSLIRAGVDILEVGVPFSDPVADGPVIARAMQRSLQVGTTPGDVLKLVKRLKAQSDIPIVLFSYLNPLLQGGEEFMREAKECGVDALLIVDLPPDTTFPFVEVIKKYLPIIPLITPSTPTHRAEELSHTAGQFLYYVCRKGTTGEKNSLPDNYHADVSAFKKVSQVPVVTGFGISNKEMAREVLDSADGFVIGSLFVRTFEETKSPEALYQLAKNLDPR